MSDEKILQILQFLDFKITIQQWNKICSDVDIEEMDIDMDNNIIFILHSKIGNLLNGIKIYVRS